MNSGGESIVYKITRWISVKYGEIERIKRRKKKNILKMFFFVVFGIVDEFFGADDLEFWIDTVYQSS
jgi:cytochrome b involved in lipid metabolism